jgi:hypothetical protein
VEAACELAIDRDMRSLAGDGKAVRLGVAPSIPFDVPQCSGFGIGFGIVATPQNQSSNPKV